MEKLVAGELLASKEAQKKTREVMNREEEWDGWKLYGKTGGGRYGTGWFVGWIEKENQHIFFAHYIELKDPNSGQSVGTLAKEEAKVLLTPYLK